MGVIYPAELKLYPFIEILGAVKLIGFVEVAAPEELNIIPLTLTIGAITVTIPVPNETLTVPSKLCNTALLVSCVAIVYPVITSGINNPSEKFLTRAVLGAASV